MIRIDSYKSQFQDHSGYTKPVKAKTPKDF
jgi:hypothetical protein